MKKLNGEDESNRKYILVQPSKETDEKSEENVLKINAMQMLKQYDIDEVASV